MWPTEVDAGSQTANRIMVRPVRRSGAKCWLASILVCGVLGLWSSSLTSAADQTASANDRPLWHSSSFSGVADQTGEGGRSSSKGDRLGDLAYNQYFETHGGPPPYDFLRPLMPAPSSLAILEEGTLVFRRTGARVHLANPPLPPQGNAASPYLLTSDDDTWVLVVQPYYVLQGKEARYFTDVYSALGEFQARFDSLPTHTLGGNRDLLVAADREGCCDSFHWVIRFYDVVRSTTAEYACPVNRCGDVLFVQLPAGPILIAAESVGMFEQQPTVETSVYIIGQSGVLLASGKLVYPLQAADDHVSTDRQCGFPNVFAGHSPLGVQSIVSVIPTPTRDGWIVLFRDGSQEQAWRMK